MALDNKHQAWLRFVRDILSVPLGRSKEDLHQFLLIAHHQHPTLVPIVQKYIELAEMSDTPVFPADTTKRVSKKANSKQMHLFDLLREKTFFPQNIDLAKFAERVVPNMRSYRFDKMSRSDIAARVIEYIEESDPKTREALESSMRLALADLTRKPAGDVERRSFLSKWERIIKGDDF